MHTAAAKLMTFDGTETKATSRQNAPEELEKWGMHFKETDLHLSKEQINSMRYQHDELAAQALDRLQKIQAADSSGDGEGQSVNATSRKDLYPLLRDNYHKDPVLTEFWDQTHRVPDWVDWEQLARGQEFFHRYIGANITGFALQGFVGENSAATGVVEVLVRTGGFSTKVLLHRLFETFQWLLQCTDNVSDVMPGGSAHASTIRVRLLHASVRQRIMKLTASRPEYYSVEKYGVAINTSDSIHSIATFCCNPMWLQLPKQGIYPRKQEIADYIALFRYLGYLLGTPDEYFETPERAKATMESMFYHELEVSRNSKVVLHNFIECLRDVAPMNISKEFIEAGSRWVNGPEFSETLEVGKPGIYYYLAFTGQIMLSWAMCWMQRLVPSLDRWIIKTSREQLKEFVMYGSVLKRPTVFDFKHIPRDSQRTEKEDGIATRQQQSQSIEQAAVSADHWIERYYFYAFLVGSLVVLGTMSFVGQAVVYVTPKIRATLETGLVHIR